MKKLMKKRTGFTLVELLIVIIIIGILAGAMLLVAGSGTDKAEATKIVSDLRSLKAAALMKWADDNSWGFASGDITVLQDYMDRQVDQSKYTYDIGYTGSFDVVYLSATGFAGTGVAEKLEAVAPSSGLYGANTFTSNDFYVDTDADAFLRIK